jgi:hypothetical protein
MFVRRRRRPISFKTRLAALLKDYSLDRAVRAPLARWAGDADFYVRRHRWFRQVLDDKELTGAGDFAVAFIIGEHLGRDTFHAFPGAAQIAKETRLTERSVTRSLGRLHRGHLIVLTGGGRGNASVLKPILRA